MKISVIIPTYNEDELITDCLSSLGGQTYKGIELVVVDDGSTDETLSKAKNHSSRPTVLKQSHQGPGAARNFGARKAKGKILVFVDADMTFDRNFIKKLVAPILEGDTIGTFSKDELVANKDNTWARSWNVNKGLPTDRMHKKDYPNTQKVFRAILKEKFDQSGGFDPKAGYTDDWSIAEKLETEAQVAPGAVFYHRNPDSLGEVFIQSKWMAKRKYKLGALGAMFALLRVSLPMSLAVGVIKSIVHTLPQFFLFKIISDLGQFIGILEFFVLGRVAK